MDIYAMYRKSLMLDRLNSINFNSVLNAFEGKLRLIENFEEEEDKGKST